jgi:uncharacterized protein with GYD domain
VIFRLPYPACLVFSSRTSDTEQGDKPDKFERRIFMSRYLVLLRFTEQGAEAMAESPTRAAAFRKSVEQAGVKVEAQYWATGGYDGIIILSGPDEKMLLRQIARLAKGGNVHTETLRLFDAEEFASLTNT